MVELLPKSIKDKIESLIGQSGIAMDEAVVFQNLRITGMPQDDFITTSMVRRAKEEAKELPENYRCFACGRVYMDRNELVACMEDHVKDYMAGIPLDILPEYEEQQMASLTPELRRRLMEQRYQGTTTKTD